MKRELTVGEPLFSLNDKRLDSKKIDMVMQMYGSGVSVEAIAKYNSLTIKEVNIVIDEFQPAFFE